MGLYCHWETNILISLPNPAHAAMAPLGHQHRVSLRLNSDDFQLLMTQHSAWPRTLHDLHRPSLDVLPVVGIPLKMLCSQGHSSKHATARGKALVDPVLNQGKYRWCFIFFFFLYLICVHRLF